MQLLCECQGDQLQLLLMSCVLPVAAKTTFHNCHNWAACNCCVAAEATSHNCSTGLIATTLRLPRRVATAAAAALRATALVQGDQPQLLLMCCWAACNRSVAAEATSHTCCCNRPAAAKACSHSCCCCAACNCSVVAKGTSHN